MDTSEKEAPEEVLTRKLAQAHALSVILSDKDDLGSYTGLQDTMWLISDLLYDASEAWGSCKREAAQHSN